MNAASPDRQRQARAAPIGPALCSRCGLPEEHHVVIEETGPDPWCPDMPEAKAALAARAKGMNGSGAQHEPDPEPVPSAPPTESDRAVALMVRDVQLAPPSERLATLCDRARDLRPLIEQGLLDPAAVETRIFEIADQHDLRGAPGSDTEALITSLAQEVTMAASDELETYPGELAELERLAELRFHQGVADTVARINALDEPPADHLQGETARRPAALALVTPTQWRGVAIPPMRWLAMNRIPADDVAILSGDGGGGKTTTALQLAVSVAANLGDWLGTTCEAGPVIFFSGEEPENEMRRRLARVARKRGLEADDISNLHFHFAEPDACTLGTGRPNFPIVPTPLFESLRQAAREIRPALIIVDSNAATLGGNYLDRVHARTFVGMFRRVAREVDCAVLLLDHPSLSGMTNGTGRAGNMDWQNAVRAFFYLRSVDNADGGKGRELEIMKTNYGPCGEKQKLRWEDGCYVLEGSAPSPQLAAAERKVDDLFLALLAERNAQGRWVTPSKAVGYAPKELALMPAAAGCTAAALANAMERLLAAKEITIETFGYNSKPRQRVIVTPLPTTLPTGN